jgi:hypothetical protein
MKILVGGSREFTDRARVFEVMEDVFFQVERMGARSVTIISGTARGSDKLGEKFAEHRGLRLERYPADWDQYGKSAGIIRNKQMAMKADIAVLFWDGESSGTKNMMEEMWAQRKPVVVVRFR